MLQQGVLGGEGFGADTADEWLFSCVHSLVNHKRMFLGEPLPTRRASERFLSLGRGKINVLGTVGCVVWLSV